MPAPFRGTYRQISDRGGHVRRGEHSTPVMFFNQHQVADTGSTRPPEAGGQEGTPEEDRQLHPHSACDIASAGAITG